MFVQQLDAWSTAAVWIIIVYNIGNILKEIVQILTQVQCGHFVVVCMSKQHHAINDNYRNWDGSLMP